MDKATVDAIQLYREIEKEIKDSILGKMNPGENFLKIACVEFSQGPLGRTFKYKFSINDEEFTGETLVNSESLEIAELYKGMRLLVVEKLTEAFKRQIITHVNGA